MREGRSQAGLSVCFCSFRQNNKRRKVVYLGAQTAKLDTRLHKLAELTYLTERNAANEDKHNGSALLVRTRGRGLEKTRAETLEQSIDRVLVSNMAQTVDRWSVLVDMFFVLFSN